MVTMRGTGLRLLLLALLLLRGGGGFELQDTLHALMEDNIRLHDQLENLTKALGELKQLLWFHSDPELAHDEVTQHLWNEWSQHDIGAETHLLLENALCGHDPHSSASPLHDHNPLLVLLCCVPVLIIGLV